MVSANTMVRKLLGFLAVMVVIRGRLSEALPVCLPVTKADIQRVSQFLTMYVDELPKIPTVFGYRVDEEGCFKPGYLTIGMFQKKWSIVLSPSEIADVVIDFSTTTASESLMNNAARYPYPNGAQPDQYNGRVMKFIIQSSYFDPPDESQIPSNLVTYTPATTATASVLRYITIFWTTKTMS
ncbi:hypothetical protein SAY86_010081 [Trapa natans]|uniref:Uncharacterized protein n=1 Tax=Trapa natans TaxID=22666 RepID=A0AAN7L5P1_TRANT|nr:hypothetical protein SAY86_010081 [Trapa natans]